MWTGRHGLRRFCVWPRPCWIWCGVRAQAACAAVLLMMVQGCSFRSSTPEMPTLPTLTSMQRLELNGVPGLWMSSDDAGRLAVWIYDVTGEVGK